MWLIDMDALETYLNWAENTSDRRYGPRLIFYFRMNGTTYVTRESAERHELITQRTGTARYTKDYSSVLAAISLSNHIFYNAFNGFFAERQRASRRCAPAIPQAASLIGKTAGSSVGSFFHILSKAMAKTEKRISNTLMTPVPGIAVRNVFMEFIEA